MTEVLTTDPRTGASRGTGLDETTEAEVGRLVAEAVAAAGWLTGIGRAGRARLLEAIALNLDAHRDELVAAAESETGLAVPRLDTELTRTVWQFRMFAEVIRDGGYLEAAIDHAAETPLGPMPDVRRMLVPLGPVAVFGASNFPFAFSVAGGDTASALAAGCPVLLKAHPSHPLTSVRSAEVISGAIVAEGGPAGVIGLVHGVAAGVALVSHPAVRAASLTGSLRAARALLAAIDRRDEPIPFYGELGSINPLVVLPGAAAGDGARIAEGLFASFTGSGGQLCTKPGLAFIPTGPDGDAIVDRLADAVRAAEGAVLLNGGIRDAFLAGADRLESTGARAVARAAVGGGTGFLAPPTLLQIPIEEMSAETAEECFGPMLVVVRYREAAAVAAALDAIPASLTTTLHAAEEDDPELVRRLVSLFEARSGRIVFGGFPTGVRVSWAQHHGGPWPATNSLHTSVGATAIRRFLRPLVWQAAPAELLPAELRDEERSIPRRVDGVLVPAAL